MHGNSLSRMNALRFFSSSRTTSKGGAPGRPSVTSPSEKKTSKGGLIFFPNPKLLHVFKVLQSSFFVLCFALLETINRLGVDQNSLFVGENYCS